MTQVRCNAMRAVGSLAHHVFVVRSVQICGIIKWRLNNKLARVRQQAADLIARIAVVLKTCNEEQLMQHLGVVLYEYLGQTPSAHARGWHSLLSFADLHSLVSFLR